MAVLPTSLSQFVFERNLTFTSFYVPRPKSLLVCWQQRKQPNCKWRNPQDMSHHWRLPGRRLGTSWGFGKASLDDRGETSMGDFPGLLHRLGPPTKFCLCEGGMPSGKQDEPTTGKRPQLTATHANSERLLRYVEAVETYWYTEIYWLPSGSLW